MVRWYESKSKISDPDEPIIFRPASKAQQAGALFLCLGGGVGYVYLILDMLKDDSVVPIPATFVLSLLMGVAMGNAFQPAFRGKVYSNEAERKRAGAYLFCLLTLMVESSTRHIAPALIFGGLALVSAIVLTRYSLAGVGQDVASHDSSKLKLNPA